MMPPPNDARALRTIYKSGRDDVSNEAERVLSNHHLALLHTPPGSPRLFLHLFEQLKQGMVVTSVWYIWLALLRSALGA